MVANDQLSERKNVCARFGAVYFAALDDQLLAVALNVREGARPLNGVRFKPNGERMGWFIWGGEDSHLENDDFYKPLHVSHITHWNSLASKYLGLPPGWRFLVTEDYEDVWFDRNILDASDVST